ncbi:tetratricopeptide repeat protein [Marinihelvus fidelis]|uniref:Tetratricopeptide repeat protein n=1 Tax=Marinihelvus fidelis TaxID=2613842 RepID=A0A5N0T779_9GAMM|nr:heme biosynthesis HemY N-terminal domain-containing protein [Marinihelvus fidelis]KAA9130843.1 tetratricopeptide repeat protein [Marinihelvus fidelis]
MKHTATWLTLLALLLLTAGLAPVFKSDPGMVQVHFRDWTLETSVLVLVGAVLLAWLLLQFALWLWRLPARTAARVAERRGLAQLEKGLLALTEGDWRTAERALQKSTVAPGRATARYLAAAQAADGQDADERRDHYLEQADSGGRRRRFLVELTRARMLVANGRFDEALPVLKSLNERRRQNPQVLGMLARCEAELGHWEAVQVLLPTLRRAQALPEDELDHLQAEVARFRLLTAEDAQALQTAWQGLPKDMQSQATVLERYAERAGQLGHAELAEPLLRKWLKKSWSPALVLRYGDPGAGDAAKRLAQCEKWLKTWPDDAALHMALGRLCAGQELWGKARHHLVRSLEIEPTAAGYDALGQLLERLGELEPSLVCYRNALRVTQGRQPEALPASAARIGPPGRE